MDEKQKKELAEAMQKARSNLVWYRKILLNCGDDEVEPPDYHFEWSDNLLHDTFSIAIQGYRESGKTQIVLRAFPLYCLTFPRRICDYIVLIKNNATLAENKLKEIETEYISNPLISGNFEKIREQSSRVFSVDVKDNNEVVNIRIEAYGKGASIRGLANLDRRPKIVIADDLQDLEDMRSEKIPGYDFDWFLSDVKFLGQKTRVFLIGNNLGEKCIMERVFNNAKHLNYRTKRIRAITTEGKSAWPGKYTIKEILDEKKSYGDMGKPHIWLREKMCQAVGEETRIFKEEDYRYYTASLAPKITQGCNMFATLDPASSKDKESCFRALLINAVDEDNKWNIVDVPYGRWDAAQLLDILFDKVVQWKLRQVGIEKGMFKQILEPFIYKEMSKRNIFFNIIPIEHAKQGTKLERIKMLQPRFKAHNIWFPDSGDWVTEMKSELAGVTKDEIKSMYIDLVDALAMQEQVAKAPYGRKKTANLPRQAEDFNALSSLT